MFLTLKDKNKSYLESRVVGSTTLLKVRFILFLNVDIEIDIVQHAYNKIVWWKFVVCKMMGLNSLLQFCVSMQIWNFFIFTSSVMTGKGGVTLRNE